jgi:hypothetical protein
LDKGRPIAELSFAQSSTQATQIDLAEGSAEIVIAIREGKCRPVNEHTIVEIALTGHGISINRSMRMGDLTWAYAQGSCDAYGYLYDSSAGLSKNFDVKSDSYKVVVRVRPGSPEQRMASLWMIYGGRPPTTRMFAPGR